jgi:hypothetical protein
MNDLKEVETVNLLNEQLLIQRGIEESQHSFETLIEACVHAGQGMLQPQLITAEKIRNLVTTQKLPSGLDYPNFPFPEFPRSSLLKFTHTSNIWYTY